jgi:hypothetical protein
MRFWLRERSSSEVACSECPDEQLLQVDTGLLSNYPDAAAFALHSAGRITVDAREKEWTADIMPCAQKKGKSRARVRNTRGGRVKRHNLAPAFDIRHGAIILYDVVAERVRRAPVRIAFAARNPPTSLNRSADLSVSRRLLLLNPSDRRAGQSAGAKTQ